LVRVEKGQKAQNLGGAPNRRDRLLRGCARS
jgi:hypothetical protein